jgi:hypothetical protein
VHSEERRGWFARLREKWQVSTGQAWIILLVFACTGTTVLLIKRPLLAAVAVDGETPVLFTVAYYALVLPIYNTLLLAYGTLFGQFQFFWAYEKRMFDRMRRLFRRDTRSPAPTLPVAGRESPADL